MIRCPNWPRLLEHRFDPQAQEPEDWSASLEHLDDCEECRLEAFGADPTLALVNLPPIEVSDDEIQRVKQAVMTLRQGLAIAEQDSSAEAVKAVGHRRLWKQNQWKVAAAITLAAGLGLAGLGTSDSYDGLVPSKPDSRVAGGFSTTEGAAVEGIGNGTSVLQPREGVVLPAAWQAAPIVEEVGSPAARVYSYPQEEADTMTLVMIIDPEIEV